MKNVFDGLMLFWEKDIGLFGFSVPVWSIVYTFLFLCVIGLIHVIESGRTNKEEAPVDDKKESGEQKNESL